MTLTQNYTAIAPNLTASFLASGGVAPITYSVRPNGAGGTVNSSTGVYTAPASVNYDLPAQTIDTIQATDSTGAVATAGIAICDVLHLIADILKNQLGLDSNHVYLWDQKIPQTMDFGLYIAIGVQSCKPFSNIQSYDGSGSGVVSTQYSNWQAIISLDVISRGFAAVTNKEQVLMALQSEYAVSQQEANSFSIGKLPPGSHFVNLSQIDGAAIPYRFNISISVLYAITTSDPASYFNTFTRTVATNP